MTKEEMILLVKRNLDLTDDTKDLIISDFIILVLEYCNRTDLPNNSEPFIRKKIRGILDYEARNGDGALNPTIASIREGDESITYHIGESDTKDGIYGFTKEDKHYLNKFRKVRNYGV